MAAIHQTIAIVDKSNKVVSTSKQLKNVFKEAKLAYLERKAEIVAERRAREEKELRKALKAASIADESRADASRRSRRPPPHGTDSEHGRRRSGEHGRYHSPEGRERRHAHRGSGSTTPTSRVEGGPRHVGLAQFNEELYGADRAVPAGHDLIRRKTDMPLDRQRVHRPAAVRSNSVPDMDQHIDMDLAYGEFHPESLQLSPQVEQTIQKQEMASLVTKCKMLLDEANCAQHSVKAMVAHLQQNPDAMAAVALTLAEISNLATKMAPAALTSFKTAAPAVFAVLASPQFLIAVGVGVGLTVVMFGGYKIIKKIKAASGESDDGVDEMLNVNDLDRINNWRRGIPDAETASVATSVEGEFITPMAAASMRDLRLNEQDEVRHKERRRSDKKRHKHRSRDDDADSTALGSEKSSRSKRSSKSKSDKREKALVKVHKPSPLRKLFSSRD